MTLELFRAHCLQKKGVTEEFPFGENTLVFKVMGKMFTATDVADFVSVNLKVDPEEAVRLREAYAAIHPGYHMNKKHWITVEMDGSIPDKLILTWLDSSYNLVVKALTKSQRAALQALS